MVSEYVWDMLPTYNTCSKSGLRPRVHPSMPNVRFGSAESDIEGSLHTYGALLLTYNRFEKLILNDSKTLYSDSAPPNLTLRVLCIHMGHYYWLIIDVKSCYWMIVRPRVHPAIISVRFGSAKSVVLQIRRRRIRHRGVSAYIWGTTTDL
jgi:hypothetical protein